MPSAFSLRKFCTVKTLLALSLCCGATLTGTALWLTSWFGGTPETDAYTTVAVEYGRAAETVSATGFVQARTMLPVGSELSGKIVEVNADYNQIVHEGDVLARLDQSLAKQHLKQGELAVEQARVAVKQAEASRDAAAKTVDRERQRSPEVRRQPDMDVVESQLRTAQVAVEAAQVRVRESEESRRQAELELRQTTIRVPTLSTSDSLSQQREGVGTLAPDGTELHQARSFIVLERKVSLNQQITPPASGSLFTLAGDLERMQVDAQVAEGDINKVMRGQRVEFTVSGNSDQEPTFAGKVEDIRLVPISDHGAVYYKVVIDVRNERNALTGDWYLRPGLTANVDILRRAHEGVWKVPAAALSVQLEVAPTAAAQAKLQRWQARADRTSWRPVWVLGADRKPWPLFVRVDNRPDEQSGIQETLATEVLEWDPEVASTLNSKDPATFPRVITSMPASKTNGLFNAPKIKF
jgi:HlyD family secretion protein